MTYLDKLEVDESLMEDEALEVELDEPADEIMFEQDLNVIADDEPDPVLDEEVIVDHRLGE